MSNLSNLASILLSLGSAFAVEVAEGSQPLTVATIDGVERVVTLTDDPSKPIVVATINGVEMIVGVL